jgi:hypothetical protein
VQGIQCQQKGYILRGKINDPSGLAKLSFELEVCRIPNLNVVGIRRKRSEPARTPVFGVDSE